jgi:hypothetical protein
MLLDARLFHFFHTFNELLMPPPHHLSDARVAEWQLNKMRQRVMGRGGLIGAGWSQAITAQINGMSPKGRVRVHPARHQK